jgi:hypothetical protein
VNPDPAFYLYANAPVRYGTLLGRQVVLGTVLKKQFRFAVGTQKFFLSIFMASPYGIGSVSILVTQGC